MVAMMKPDIGLYMRKLWKGLPLLRDVGHATEEGRKGKGQRHDCPTI